MSRTKLLAQSVHCACDVAPADGECVPLTQLSQAGAPGVAEYVSAKQSVHVKAPAAEDLPAAQAVQVLVEEAPAVVEYLPLTQLSQAGAPGVAEYVPAKQSVHVKAPAFEDLPAAQAVQLLVEEAPAVVEYLPAGHEVQLGAPVTILYFPCAHAMQLPPFGPV